MAKPFDAETCANVWHSTLSIRQETCPSCGGTAKTEDDTPGVAVVTDMALGIVEAVSDAMDGSDDDD